MSIKLVRCENCDRYSRKLRGVVDVDVPLLMERDGSYRVVNDIPAKGYMTYSRRGEYSCIKCGGEVSVVEVDECPRHNWEPLSFHPSARRCRLCGHEESGG